ncbi:hypothetical protein BJV82DRAFT_672688 [Fennellomyces sp. T-0311]|nr:hypothetical protein BJV82DRAFT_672688 [Fennellomyces sp. T-0311]
MVNESDQTGNNTVTPEQDINNLLFHDWNDIQQSTLHSVSSSSTTSNDKEPSVKSGKKKNALKPFNPHGSKDASHLQPTTGRLDFRVSTNSDCNVTDSQLKKMTSKERRQLRNKISARNFRQRRKDYITALEEQIEQLENDKSQLKLEVKNVYGIVAKLQKENDQLRLDLLLSRQGIVTTEQFTAPSEQFTPPEQFTSPQQFTVTPEPEPRIQGDFTIPELTFNPVSSPEDALFDTIDTDFTSSSSPSSADSSWDLVLPDSTWLSHAAIPHWDWSRILDKTPSPQPGAIISARDMFQKYPLLAPALMSIVVGHTMSMSTEQLINATLMPSYDESALTFDPKSPTKQTLFTHDMLRDLFKIAASAPPMLTEKEQVTEHDEEKEEEQQQNKEPSEAASSSCTWAYAKNPCPSTYIVPFLQRQLCRVVQEVCYRVQQMDACRKNLCPITKQEPAEQQPMSTSSQQSMSRSTQCC